MALLKYYRRAVSVKVEKERLVFQFAPFVEFIPAVGAWAAGWPGNRGRAFVERSSRPPPYSSRRQLLRARRSQPAGHRRGAPAEKTLGHPVPARELFAEPTLRGFARRLTQLGQAALAAEVLSDRATEGQREFWVAEQAGLDMRGFNISLTLAARGEWRSAWPALVKRHDALRTCFYEDPDGVLRRSVLPEIVADLEVANQADMPAALAHIRERQLHPFAMESPPLWHAGLVHVAGTDEPLFWLALHHSVGDGVSLGVLGKELSILLEGGD